MTVYEVHKILVRVDTAVTRMCVPLDLSDSLALNVRLALGLVLLHTASKAPIQAPSLIFAMISLWSLLASSEPGKV